MEIMRHYPVTVYGYHVVDSLFLVLLSFVGVLGLVLALLCSTQVSELVC